MRNLEDKKTIKKTAPKTYKINNNKKNKNHEISSSRFLFSHTPEKKIQIVFVLTELKNHSLKKKDPLPVLLIFILEKKPHTF